MRVPFEYRLKRSREAIGRVSLELVCLENLDDTIDALFVELERTGNGALLEELCPYFGVVWPAARALSEQLAESWGARLPGASVLEVGCGLAVPSLVCAKLGARVTATDFHPEVPVFLDRNLALNAVQGLRYVRVDWQHAEEVGELGRFDLVVGSDVLYEQSHPEGVARMMARCVAPGGHILLADPARPYLQRFVDEMTRQGFSSESSVSKDVFILEFTEN